MRLSRLEINGFKSFARKTELVFGNGITAVIGPNGSGKSNIADAVRWVLGEQSARALRGTRMEDVIFNGTQQRRAQAYCEVTLTFDNADGALPVPFSEVAVTRRVYRSGESEYCLNHTACRLRDILELFRDTGIGKDGYSIIGQGKVDEILSNKSEERRAALEEAAGVMRYRVRKEEAARKLEHTEKNLERIDDILTELGDRLQPLEEQSAAARAFLKLRDELRDLEVNLFLYQYDRNRERLSSLESAIRQMEEEEAQNEALSAELQTEADALERQVAELDATLSEQQNRLVSLLSGVETHVGECNLLLERREHAKAELQRLQAERDRLTARSEELGQTLAEMTSDTAGEAAMAQLTRDIAAAEASLAAQDAALLTAEAELERRKNEMMEAMNRLADAKSGSSRFDAMAAAIAERLEAIARQRTEQTGARAALETEYTEAQAELSELTQARQTLQGELDTALQNRAALEKRHADAVAEQHGLEQETGSVRSRLRVLREMARSREGYYTSVKRLMDDAARDKQLAASVVGVVAELIHVPKRFETAIGMALGSSLQNIVTPTAEDAKYVIEYLRRKDYGRATLLPISLLHRNPANEAELRQLRMEHCFGLASELVECNDEMRPVVEYLLGRTAVVEDLAAGIALKKRTGGAFHIATLEGDIISTGGAMSGGSRQKRGFSLLGREREMEELQQALQQKEARLETLQGACEELRKALLLADMQADAFRAELHEKDLAITRQSEKVDIIDRDRARAEEQAGRLEEERQQLDENLADIRRQREESVALQRDIESGNATSREDVQRAQAALAGKRAEREAASQQLTEQKVRLMALQKERDAVEAERNRLSAERDAANAALSAQETAIRETAAQIAAADQRLEEMRQGVQAEQAEAGAQKEQHRRLEEERAARADSLAQLRKRREEALQSAREIGERKHRQELQKSRAEMELAGMQDRIWEEYELTYENALPYRHDIPIAASGTRVNEIKAEIRDMGDINLSAIEDYRAVSERHAALAAQSADLRQAKADLETLIAELTDTMQGEFSRQLHVIQQNFTRVFAELFGGGHAELRLSDEKDVLGCDIDIIAQPPGKKLQLLSLLSGGERALTAIALLFAMLQLKPPAFCVLDEIESSLDEVNVTRFADYLKAYSDETQFIIITHRKGSMEVCDSLYGVSMEERGVSKVVSARFDAAG